MLTDPVIRSCLVRRMNQAYAEVGVLEARVQEGEATHRALCTALGEKERLAGKIEALLAVWPGEPSCAGVRQITINDLLADSKILA